MKLFIDKLIEKVREKRSHICVGLDPHLNLLPSFLVGKEREKGGTEREILSRAVITFNREIIDQIADVAAAVKPQIAFYEQLGAPGIKALENTIQYARQQGLIIILDAKRNDIGSTARAYAAAHLGNYSDGNNLHQGDKDNYNRKLSADNIVADAITINPYLGYNGIEPFIASQDKGAFALVRTSNSSGGEVQDLELKDGNKLYLQMGKLVSDWGSEVGESGYSNLGAVVGATYPGELKLLRQNMPHSYFLIPGYGAQGGKAEDVVYGFNEDKLGAIVNSARGIIFAYREQDKETEFGQAAREAAQEMRDKINKALY